MAACVPKGARSVCPNPFYSPLSPLHSLAQRGTTQIWWVIPGQNRLKRIHHRWLCQFGSGSKLAAAEDQMLSRLMRVAPFYLNRRGKVDGRPPSGRGRRPLEFEWLADIMRVTPFCINSPGKVDRTGRLPIRRGYFLHPAGGNLSSHTREHGRLV